MHETSSPNHPATANFGHQLWIISLFELRRLFATRRGAFYLITFAILWYLFLAYPLLSAAELVSQNQGNEQGVSILNAVGLGSLMAWSVPEFAVYWRAALYLFPMLSIFLAADQTTSDRERGMLRFLVLRSTRDNIFFGRFCGVMLIQALLILATLLSTLAIVLWRDLSLLLPALTSAGIAGVNLILVVLPFSALMALLSISASTPRQATVWAILIWTLLATLINGLSYYIPALSFLHYLVPGMQISELAQLTEWQTFSVAGIPLLQTLVLLLAGRSIMVWRAL